MVCYTYGLPSSYEVKIAKKVVEKLNCKWHFIEYPKNWKPYFEDESYQIFAAQFCSLPHEQDYLAIQELTKKKLIDKDAILVPGFCGDLLGGSAIPDFYEKNLQINQQKLVQYIVDTQFCYENNISKIDRKRLLENIQNEIKNHHEVKNIDNFIAINECFFTKNLVSKYVVNAIRIFEYFGYEWSLPLWDNELMEWWYQVPNEDRVGEDKLFDQFLLNHVFAKNEIAIKKHKKRVPKYFLKQFLGEKIMKIARVAFINSPFYNDINSTIPLLKLYQKDLKLAGKNALITTKPNKIMAAWTLLFLENKINSNHFE